MTTLRITVISCFLSVVTAGCGKKESPVYRLTAEQLAWQPYRVGDVLRFGRSGSAKTRTFTITQVNDRIETYSNGGGGISLWPVEQSKLEEIDVLVRRTDTLRYVRVNPGNAASTDSVLHDITSLLSIRADDNHGIGPVVVQAELDWELGPFGSLPLQEVTTGRALPDTTARLLPSLQLGGVSYGPVIQVSNSNYGALPRATPVRRLYYAKGAGVVGFVEGRALWYRLP